MAITFAQQEKRQKYLLFILSGVVLLSLVIVWRGFFVAPAVPPVPEAEPEVLRRIEIDFGIFDHPFFAQIIEEFPRIPDFVAAEVATGEMQLGRPNPFAPIGVQEFVQPKEE